MRHFVTGGSGYLGNIIARHFFERGEDVTVLDLWEDTTRAKGIKFIKGDILDRELIRSSLVGTDIVHHTAALVPLTKSGSRFADVNVAGSALVAEEAANAKVQAFIHHNVQPITTLR